MASDLADPTARRRFYLMLIRKRARPGSGSSLEMLRRRTWRLPVFPLESIVQTPFVIVGGVATRLYAPERMTEDLDVLIAAEDAGRFYAELQQGGGQRQGRLTIPGSHWRLPDGSLLDVLESEEPWVREALTNPAFAPDGLPVISLPYLILLKMRSGRITDLADVSRMLGGAEEDALDQVRAAVRAYQPGDLEDLESVIQLGRLEYEERQEQ